MYSYDIFFSYKRNRHSDAWHRRVAELIEYWTQKLLNQASCRVFFDTRDLTIGPDWRSEIADNLLKSKCLVCMIDVAYVYSAPCRSELQSFLDREDSLGLRRGALIAPALYYDGQDHLPQEVRHLNYIDFSNYSATIAAFWNTEIAASLEDMIKNTLCPAIAQKIASVPDFDIRFPVNVVDEIFVGVRPGVQRPSEIVT